MHQFHADGVLGPVRPYFEAKPPLWVIRGRLCERKSFPTGTFFRNYKYARTGNVLLDKKLFADKKSRFDSQFGLTGGEDQDFFKRMINNGRHIVWCNEALVYETVPPERWGRSFYTKKYLQMGGQTGELARKWPLVSKCKWLVKSLLATCFYSLLLPFSCFFGHHVFMKCLLKDLYFFGWLAGFLWRPIIRYRY